jgi:anti-sigma B factor antagonist
MNINEDIINKIGVLKLSGRLDAASVKYFKDTVASLVKKEIKNIVVDMKEVEFVDSSGLGSLVSCLRIVNNKDGDIRLASLQNQIRGLIELTRMHRVFQIFDDTETAINSY